MCLRAMYIYCRWGVQHTQQRTGDTWPGAATGAAASLTLMRRAPPTAASTPESLSAASACGYTAASSVHHAVRLACRTACREGAVSTHALASVFAEASRTLLQPHMGQFADPALHVPQLLSEQMRTDSPVCWPCRPYDRSWCAHAPLPCRGQSQLPSPQQMRRLAARRHLQA